MPICVHLWLTLFFLLPSLHAADVTLIKDGRSDFTIATPHPTPAAQYAAEELAEYLKRMTGASLPINPASPGKHRIVIGKWGEVIPLAGFVIPESYSVGPAEPDTGDLYLLGENDRAVLFAVYQFLNSQGCRFLAPNFAHYRGSAEFIPHRATLTVSQPLHSSPKLKFRKLYVEEGISHTPENLTQLIEWMPKVGYNTLVIPLNYQGHDRVKWDTFRASATPELQKRGITIEVGGHGYQNFLNAKMEDGKLFQLHPDYFHQDASAHRLPDTEHHVFCTSNPQAVAYLTQNFLTYLKTHPEIQIYDFWPPDGAAWCACDACKSLGSPSDRQALLLAHVAAEAKKLRPDLRLEAIAYSNYVAPPEHQTIDPTVLIDFCPINQQFDHPIDDPAAEKNAAYVQNLRAWRKSFKGDISIYSYYRKYAWDSLPGTTPTYIQHDLRFYATLPTQGISTYSEPGDWATYELNHYCLAALAWNPDTDLTALINKFVAARYAAPAPPPPALADVAQTLLTLGDDVRTCGSLPNTTLKPPADIQAAIDRTTAAESLATTRAADATDPATKLAYARLALIAHYVRTDLDLQHLRATHAPRDEIRAKSDALYTFLTAHKTDGLFLTDRTSPARLARKYAPAAARPPR